MSMPPVGYWPLGWFALAPLFYAVQATRAVWGFAAGMLCAIVAAVCLQIGIVPLPYRAAGEPNWIYGGYMLFGLLVALFAGVIGDRNLLRFRYLPILAALAVCLEALMMVIPPVHLALSQYRQPAALFLASFGGIWAVSYLMWLTNLLLAKAMLAPKQTLALAVGWVAVVAASYVAVGFPRSAYTGPTVAVIQTQALDAQTLARLDARSTKLGARLAIWPELSGTALAPEGDTSALRRISSEQGIGPFVTSFEDNHSPKPHNAAALFEHGQESVRYFKRKPFAGEATLHEAGDQAVAVMGDMPVGLNICFDSCYPAVMRETVLADPIALAKDRRNGPRAKPPSVSSPIPHSTPTSLALVALPTEDPISGNGVIQAIHSAYLPFRAAELGVPMARADITAYSMIVGSNGQTLGELGPGEGVLVRRLDRPHNTFYRRFGDWFLYLCFLAVGSSFLSALRKRKPKSIESPRLTSEGNDSQSTDRSPPDQP